jgi:hypothetical protein
MFHWRFRRHGPAFPVVGAATGGRHAPSQSTWPREFFEVWELDLRCWGPLRRARAPSAAFPANSATSDWFSTAPATVAPRAANYNFFLFLVCSYDFSFVFGVSSVFWVCFSDVIRAFCIFGFVYLLGFGCFWADLGEYWGAFLGFGFLAVLGVSRCCMRVLGLVLMGLFGFFFLWVSFGCFCVYF